MISDEKFSKSDRLLKNKDFKRAYNTGSRVRKDDLLLYHVPNNASTSRFGIVVSSRIVKLASGRNRIKRILRDICRKEKPRILKGQDIVIVVKKSYLNNKKQYIRIKSAFLGALNKAKIII